MAEHEQNQASMTEDEIRLKNEQTFDSTLSAMVTKLQEYVAPLINEMFQENYSDQVQVTIRNNKRILFLHDGSLRRRETDAFIELKEQVESLIQKLYHFECETWFDDTIVIRISEYEMTTQELLKRVSDRLTLQYKDVREGVDQVMSGYIARTRADEILDKGQKKGSVSATKLINYLWKNNRGDDAIKAEKDHNYYLKLLQEYNEANPTPILAEDADSALYDVNNSES